MMHIGIDIGGSTTKIVGVRDQKIMEPLTVEANDPIASASGALGKFLDVHRLQFSDIHHMMVTGVGASFLDQALLGIPITKVDEFKALGYGGLFLTGLKKAIIVSMGTGTAFVKAHGRCIRHLGGTGVGGGTITGLSGVMAGLTSIKSITEAANKGRLEEIDLSVGDIAHTDIGNLPVSITASNFGKMTDQANKNDMVKGVLNMTFQVVGMMAIFAARNEKDRDIVLSGKLVNIPMARLIFRELSELYGMKFHLPDYADCCTAIGAAISVDLDYFLE
ncbi:MAG: type II pantothenate kinase [Bacteroidales bacterium]